MWNLQWPTCDLSKPHSVWLAGDADPTLPLSKCPKLKISFKKQKKATTQGMRHKQAAQSLVLFPSLCVSCFYWGFRPFHGYNKDIRTCCNIPHIPPPCSVSSPPVYEVFLDSTDSRGLPEEEGLVKLCPTWIEKTWMFFLQFLQGAWSCEVSVTVGLEGVHFKY